MLKKVVVRVGLFGFVFITHTFQFRFFSISFFSFWPNFRFTGKRQRWCIEFACAPYLVPLEHCGASVQTKKPASVQDC